MSGLYHPHALHQVPLAEPGVVYDGGLHVRRFVKLGIPVGDRYAGNGQKTEAEEDESYTLLRRTALSPDTPYPPIVGLRGSATPAGPWGAASPLG